METPNEKREVMKTMYEIDYYNRITQKIETLYRRADSYNVAKAQAISFLSEHHIDGLIFSVKPQNVDFAY